MDDEKTKPVAARLRGLLAQKAAGTRLPSARQLAAELDVGRGVVNRLVTELVATGEIRREGNRLFVAQATRAASHSLYLVGLSGEAIDPAAQVVTALGGETVRHIAEDRGGVLRKALIELRTEQPEGILVRQPLHLDVLERLEAAGSAVVLAGAEWPGHNYVCGLHARSAEIAMQHLVDLGHRAITFVLGTTTEVSEQQRSVQLAGYRQACAALDMPECRERIVTVTKMRELNFLWQQLLERLDQPTALICSDSSLARELLALAPAAGVRVPSEVSIIALNEDPKAALCEPPLTTVDVDDDLVARTGAFILWELVTRKRKKAFGQQRHAVALEPTLSIRRSTAEVEQVSTRRLQKRDVARWSDDEGTRLRQAADLNARCHSFASAEPQFESVDLSAKVNRGFHPRSAWLGDQPLRFFRAGTHMIHGVPFTVATGKERRHRAIVLRSRKARKSGHRDLPELVEIPLDAAVQSVFLLHAAGWTVRNEAFARYEFCYASGETANLDVRPYAFGPENEGHADDWLQAATIQDWHATYRRVVNANTLPYLVCRKGDPFLYERYLYSHRWENPYPEKRLKAIRVRSLNSELRATLAVLAITLELAVVAA